MNKQDAEKLVMKNIPYLVIGLLASNMGEAWRISQGADTAAKLLDFFTSGLAAAWKNPLPSLHPFDMLIGICIGAVFRLLIYIKSKNAKKYRRNTEYGSARWGTHKDIEPFIDPDFSKNVILTQTERLMMNNRPKDPTKARNKNVLVVGGSGSGKTRFFIKPNLMQLHSSYVVTDPNGYTIRG